MNTAEIEKSFVNNFIKKDKRERSIYELNHPKKRFKFIDRFNHDWESLVNKTNLIPVPKGELEGCLTFIKAKLKTKGNEQFYIISLTEDDKTITSFEEAFSKIHGNGFAALIISVDSKKYYLETEQVSGAPDRFVGYK